MKPLARFSERVQRELGFPEESVSVCFVSDLAMARMNRKFRAKQGPTDVLSFPTDSTEPEFAGYLGDLIISAETAAHDAQELGLTFEVELRMLIIHGLLHLCGYDHETDRGAMSRLENRLREQLLR